MSNTLLDLTTPTLPDGFCWPSTPQALANALFALSKAVWPGTITGIHIGTTPPADLTLLWVKTDSNGAPIGSFTYTTNGWVMPHPEAPNSGFRKLWIGLAANVPTLDGGNANVVADADGPFWAIDTNYAFRIPIGPGTNPAGGYDGNLANIVPEPSDVANTSVGGIEQIQLGIGNLPPHAHNVRTRTDGGVGASAGFDRDGVQGVDAAVDIEGGEMIGTPPTLQAAHFSVMNPWKATYFLKRTSRKYLVG